MGVLDFIHWELIESWKMSITIPEVNGSFLITCWFLLPACCFHFTEVKYFINTMTITGPVMFCYTVRMLLTTCLYFKLVCWHLTTYCLFPTAPQRAAVAKVTPKMVPVSARRPGAGGDEEKAELIQEVCYTIYTHIVRLSHFIVWNKQRHSTCTFKFHLCLVSVLFYHQHST